MTGDFCLWQQRCRQVRNSPDYPHSTLVNFYLNLGARISIKRGFYDGLCVTIAREIADHLEVLMQAGVRR